mgnify:CR=1 FL=1
MTYFTTFLSPIGELTLTGNDASLTGLYFSTGPKARSADPAWERDDQRFVEAAAQLHAYFAGRLRAFDLPLKPRATPFQAQVLGALQEIPYGESRSYKDIAQAIGNPKAVRAAGSANARNNVAVLIPCHRVVRKGGDLGGYAYGPDIKRELLKRERR